MKRKSSIFPIIHFISIKAFQFKKKNFFSLKLTRTIDFLKNAIFENDFMKNLELEQIDKIIGCLFPVEFPKDSLIIKEGEIGNTLYITGGYFIL